jgi:MFS family permease
MDKKMKRVLLATSFGTILEWYDFFLYGTAAALVLPKLFFPQSDPLVGTLLSFAAYATGFLARPLGGIISGHFGDRFSRKATLLATLLVMGLATFLIGVLPTYSQVGALAPILLVTLRVIQGLATGGEWGGASLLTLEHTTERRAFFGSFISVAVFGGLILGNVVFVALNAVLSKDQLLAWGWRVPFLLSILMVAVGVFIRRRVEESPELRRVTKQDRSRTPLLEALRAHPRNIIAIFLVRVGQNTSFYIVSVFCLTYATTALGIESWVTLTALLVGSVFAAIACPLWGTLADRIGYPKVMIGSLIASALIAAPLFMILGTGSAPLIIVSFVVALAGVTAASDAIQPGYFTSMFGAKIRYSGVSIGREGGTIVGGGLAPIIATALFAQTGNWWAVAGWMIFTAIAGIVGVALAHPIVDTAATSQEEPTAGPTAARAAVN